MAPGLATVRRSYQISALGATTINRQLGTVQLAGVTRGIQIELLGGLDVLVLDGSPAELAVSGKLRIRSRTGSTAIGRCAYSTITTSSPWWTYCSKAACPSACAAALITCHSAAWTRSDEFTPEKAWAPTRR